MLPPPLKNGCHNVLQNKKITIVNGNGVSREWCLINAIVFILIWMSFLIIRADIIHLSSHPYQQNMLLLLQMLMPVHLDGEGEIV